MPIANYRFYSFQYFIFIIFFCLSMLHPRAIFVDFNTSRPEFAVANPINMTGLILARGGSKGIPKKNLALFKGETLLRRAILTMKECGRFSSIWVSTDDEEIAQEAESLGVFVYSRSIESATDTASSLMAVQEFCKNKPGVSYIGLVQCTSPFIVSSFLQEAYYLISRGYDSVFSATRDHKLRWKEIADGEIVPVNFNQKSRPRRQDWKGDLVENGMFYFTNVALVNSGVLQGGRVGFVEVSNLRSIEIDNPIDLTIAGIIFDTHLSSI